MNRKQTKQIGTLENLKSSLLLRLSEVSREDLNRTPAAGGWSPAQVLFHVIQAERLSLQYLRKKTQQPESVPRSGLVAAIKSRALGAFLAMPFKVSAPPRSADVPASSDLEDLEQQWGEVRSGWQEFLETLPAGLAVKAIYKHPMAGRFNLEQTLRFLIDHLRRHRGQIERALRARSG